MQFAKSHDKIWFISVQVHCKYHLASSSDLKQIGILSLAICFVILIALAGVMIICKLRVRRNHPPSSLLLQPEHDRVHKGPLPPVPQDAHSHYRSLIRQTDPHAFPKQSRTMPKPQPQQDLQEGDDYSTDWRFGTAPWNKTASID